MFDRIIFDIRSLQKSSIYYSPLDRTFAALVMGLPPSILTRCAVALFADHARDIPPSLEEWRDRIIYAPPFRNETILVIEPESSDSTLLDLMQPRLQASTQLITLSDKAAADLQAPVLVGTVEQVLAVRLRANVKGRKVDEKFSAIVPVAADASLRAGLDPLEKVEADVLLGGSDSVLAVDGALAANKDVMRALLGLTRRHSARVLVLGDATAVQAPEVSVLRARPSLVGEIARRSVAVLVPAAGGAQAISEPEAAQLGTRSLAIHDSLEVHSLEELEALRISSVETPSEPDYGPFWGKVFDLVPEISVTPAPQRPRVALVTPIFPQSGGPPHSSLDLAMALSECADVEIWTDGDMLPAHRARVCAVFRLDSPFNPAKYDLVVYVLGNHPMYTKIFDLMREHGGALILHDAHMIDFLNSKFGERRLGAILSNEYGKPIQVDNVGRIITDLSSYGRPFLREIVRHANPTIVHSPTSATCLRSLYGIDAKYFPVAMPYPFDPSELTRDARLQAKLALGISPTRPCIASFGEVNLSKGAKQCLFVMKELADWGIDFQFMFVGPVEPHLRDELEMRVKEYGLRDNVLIKGSVSEADYIQHLKAADIVLQIRQIPFGQVSGALLDAVSAGMHGVASENLAISIEAPEMIRRVEDKASPTIYAEQIAQLIETRDYESRPGPGWENFTDKHSFRRYARELLSLLTKS